MPTHQFQPAYGNPVELPKLEDEEPEPDLAAQGKTHGMVVVADHLPLPQPETDHRSVAAVKKDITRKIRGRVGNNSYQKAKQHFQSLAFGLGIGSLVLLVTLFSFFNEVVIAPFIHPGATASATPIILSTDGVAPTDKNEVIIPKINVELPIIYDSSANENDIENNLEDGVVHYPTTAVPGQQGNAAFFGHSSNNIFNKGKYKFAFVLLHELEPGDIFYLTYNGKLYTYKVFDKKIVKPEQTSVLNPVVGKTSTATLITCDPPGTSINRLVVWGEQISPDPNSNAAATATPVTKPATLPSQSPSLWSRMWSWL
jgi:sortase A